MLIFNDFLILHCLIYHNYFSHALLVTIYIVAIFFILIRVDIVTIFVPKLL